jgi:hypothetical protein
MIYSLRNSYARDKITGTTGTQITEQNKISASCHISLLNELEHFDSCIKQTTALTATSSHFNKRIP